MRKGKLNNLTGIKVLRRCYRGESSLSKTDKSLKDFAGESTGKKRESQVVAFRRNIIKIGFSSTNKGKSMDLET
jgi:hypothetical protein